MGSDFSFVDSTFTLDDTTVFAPSGMVLPFAFTAIDDALVEGDETVDLIVTNVTSTAGGSTSDPVNTQVETEDGVITITDNDAAQFVIAQDVTTIAETGATAVEFTISLVDPVSVSYTHLTLPTKA